MEFKNSQLMFVATASTFILLVLLLFFPIPDANAQIFLAVSSFVLGFFFGSSTNKQRPAEPPQGGTIDETLNRTTHVDPDSKPAV